MSKNGKNRPSVLNWMGSLILYAIPGVNLIFLILSIIFFRKVFREISEKIDRMNKARAGEE